MARTSKKKQPAFGALADKKPQKIYSVGIYARLSVDGDERKKESIETQMEIAEQFIGRHSDMTVYGRYTDIGKTGTNFEREGFERMMRDVRMRKIDCIVVKDLSRFGRNHIETGNYIEKIFPFMGVRFIAVTDHFDSMNLTGQNESLSVNLKNLVNEMYAKDIAVKVRSSKKAKREQGGYTGGVAPYGYRAVRTGDKKCLAVEEKSSDIVRKIYELFLSGRSIKGIVRWLYENQLVMPTEYFRTGQIYCQENAKLRQWPRCTVKRILTNPVYMGCLVQGQACGKEYRMRERQDIAPEDWSVKEHTHEAIISEEVFFEAAAKFEQSAKYCNKDGFSKAVPQEEDIFAGVFYCGDCGAKMKRISSIKCLGSENRVRIYGYNCPNFKRIDEFKCVGKSISLRCLTDIVKEAIRQEFALSGIRPEQITERNDKEAEALKKKWNRQAADLGKKLERITRLGSEQYFRYRMGEMEEAHFKQAKEENDKNADLLCREREVIAENIRMIDDQTDKKNRFLLALLKGGEKSKLTAEVVRTLIDRIEIYPDHRVKIIFAFQRNFCND